MTVRSSGQVKIREKVSIFDVKIWFCVDLFQIALEFEIEIWTASLAKDKLRIDTCLGNSSLTSTIDSEFFTLTVLTITAFLKMSWDSEHKGQVAIWPITHDFKNAFGGRTRPLSSSSLILERCLLSKILMFPNIGWPSERQLPLSLCYEHRKIPTACSPCWCRKRRINRKHQYRWRHCVIRSETCTVKEILDSCKCCVLWQNTYCSRLQFDASTRMHSSLAFVCDTSRYSSDLKLEKNWSSFNDGTNRLRYSLPVFNAVN